MKKSTRQPSSGLRPPSPAPASEGQIPAGEGYLDKVAVAKRLGLRPRTVAQWARQGRLPWYRFGRYLRFSWEEVQVRLAETCRVAGEKLKIETRTTEMGLRHLTPTLSPLEAEREQKTKRRSTNPAL